ncbi:hypothetical protein [Paenibacillus camelliae]|uniref:hypothetical protein n=1 Tax=Paenibacillus camelliae TaxID=512410 RepID=UPI002040A870|nr:hypothetical protein [Paenibacillus camelliae]MCM3635302.1 hypothetical protein [Paenibacillus camelliae]
MSENTLDNSILQNQLLNLLKQSLTKSEFMEWFSELNIEELTNDNRIIFGTSDKEKKEYLEVRYFSLLKSKLRELTGHDYELHFNVKSEVQKTSKKIKKPISDVFGILGPVSDEVKEKLKGKSFQQIREEARAEYINEKYGDLGTDGETSFDTCSNCGSDNPLTTE